MGRDWETSWVPTGLHEFAGAGPALVVNGKEKDRAFGCQGAFNGAHLKADYDGLGFQTVSGDTKFRPGVTLIEAPGHTPWSPGTTPAGSGRCAGRRAPGGYYS